MFVHVSAEERVLMYSFLKSKYSFLKSKYRVRLSYWEILFTNVTKSTSVCQTIIKIPSLCNEPFYDDDKVIVVAKERDPHTFFVFFQKMAGEKEALEEDNFALKHKLDVSKTRYHILVSHLRIFVTNREIRNN